MTEKSIFNGVDVGDPVAVERARVAQLVGEIRAAALHHLRAIVRGEFRGFPIHGVDIARRIIRIEVDHKTMDALIRFVMRYEASPYGREGPVSLDGIDVYELSRLPAPGWRVVNPYWIKS